MVLRCTCSMEIGQISVMNIWNFVHSLPVIVVCSPSLSPHFNSIIITDEMREQGHDQFVERK